MPIIEIAGTDEPLWHSIHDRGGQLYDAENPRYGIKWDNVRDDGQAVQDLWDDVGERGGGLIMMPHGTGKIVTPPILRHPDVHVRGKGKTVMNFKPTAPGTLCKIQHHAGGLIGRCGFSRIEVASLPAENIAKTAFEIVDGTQCYLEDITAVEGNWDGAGSIGFRFRGRELTRLGSGITMATERPIVFDPNPGSAVIGCDHFLFFGTLHLIGRGTLQNAWHGNYPVITKNPGCPVTSMGIRGTVSMNRGSQGLLWRSTDGVVSDASLSQDIDLTGFRREQPIDPGAGNELYAMDFDGSAQPIYNLRIRQASLSGAIVDGRSKAIRLVYVKGAKLGEILYTGPFAALEMGEGCDDIEWDGYYCIDNATLINSGALHEVSRERATNSSFPTKGRYAAVATAPSGYTPEELQKPQSRGGVNTGLLPIAALANDGEIRLPIETTGVGQNRIMRIEVCVVGVDNTTEAYGLWTLNRTGPQSALRQDFTANCSNADTANKLCVVWINASRAMIINNLGQTVNGWYRFEFVA